MKDERNVYICIARIKTIEVCVLLPSASLKIEKGYIRELVVRSLLEIAWLNSVNRLTRYIPVYKSSDSIVE